MPVLIPATTAAANSPAFTANANNTGILADGLGAGEIVKLQVWSDSKDSFVDVKISGKVPQADSSNNMIAIQQDAFKYRVVKTVTATAIGVDIFQNSVKVGGF